MHRCSTSNLIHIYNMTHSYVRHVSFIRVTWLIHTCDMTHSYVRRDSSIRVTWLMYTCNMTHSYVRHDSFICEVALQLKQATHNHVSTSMCLYPPSFMHRGILTKSLSALSHLTVPCNHTLYASPTYTQKEPYIHSKRALHKLKKSTTYTPKEPYIQRHSASCSSRASTQWSHAQSSLYIRDTQEILDASMRHLMHRGILSQVAISSMATHLDSHKEQPHARALCTFQNSLPRLQGALHTLKTPLHTLKKSNVHSNEPCIHSEKPCIHSNETHTNIILCCI